MAGLTMDEPAPFRFELLRDEEPEATALRVEGELDLSNIDEVQAAVDPVIKAHPDRLVIEAGGLRFADSSAIAALVGWAAIVRELEIRNPPHLLRSIIESMGLAETLPMRP
ncbi:MAG: STAS domain-containing protein [Solirubrobacteraceae bacterium]